MSSFTVRVELHGASSEHYELLHDRMLKAQYYRWIYGASDGGERGYWTLPTAEYDHTSEATVSQIRDEVLVIANSVKRGAWVLVTEAGDRAWSTEVIRLGAAA